MGKKDVRFAVITCEIFDEISRLDNLTINFFYISISL